MEETIKKNILLTNYLQLKDPQGNNEWNENNKEFILTGLLDSAKKNKCSVEVLDRIDDDENPYFQRWLNIERYLLEHEEIEKVWCLDAGDIIVLKNPFDIIVDGIIYCGFQNDKVGTLWLIYNHNSYPEVDFINKFRDYKLLNAGILGGTRRTVLKFVENINSFRRETKDVNRSLTDMCIYNMVAWTKFKDKIVCGEAINTQFGQFELNDKSLFKHK